MINVKCLFFSALICCNIVEKAYHIYAHSKVVSAELGLWICFYHAASLRCLLPCVSEYLICGGGCQLDNLLSGMFLSDVSSGIHYDISVLHHYLAISQSEHVLFMADLRLFLHL